jgi:hypothetical protein
MRRRHRDQNRDDYKEHAARAKGFGAQAAHHSFETAV